MTDTASVTPETMEYRTEVKQLLNILAHSLYTDREIFLRELISNSSDALNRIQFELLTNQDVVDPQAELAIKIDVDPNAKTITISDSGIGMNHDELIENLGTIAHSGAKTFMQNAANNGKVALEEIIGQFGVGFYSVFTVADEVNVTSRSYRLEDGAWSWQSSGDSQFTITPSEKSDRGTTIVIKLKEDASEFASTWRLESIIKKHSDYVSFPIYVKDQDADAEAKIANRRTALWRQSPSKTEAKEYEEFYKQLTFADDAPLAHIHFVTDAPVNIRSILFIPSKRERRLLYANADFGLRLYSRKVLIQQRNKDLLPEYLRFVEGVVDSEDLPLNVSREMVQSNPVLRRMSSALSGRILKELKTLSEGEADKYNKFWEQQGVFIKEGVVTDFASHDALVDLLRFHSSRSGEERWVSLKEYSERSPGDQTKIYYVLGDDFKSAARSPHLDYFRANDIEVLYLTEPIDGFMINSLREYSGKQLQNVDDSNLELPTGRPESERPETDVTQDEYDKLQKRVSEVLGDRVKGVRESKQLVSSPSRLVSDDAMERDMERIRRITGEEAETLKRVLELNRSHPIVAGLAHKVESGGDDSLINATIEQLFDNALLLEGLHKNPADMVERIQQLMAAAMGGKAG